MLSKKKENWNCEIDLKKPRNGSGLILLIFNWKENLVSLCKKLSGLRKLMNIVFSFCSHNIMLLWNCRKGNKQKMFTLEKNLNLNFLGTKRLLAVNIDIFWWKHNTGFHELILILPIIFFQHTIRVGECYNRELRWFTFPKKMKRGGKTNFWHLLHRRFVVGVTPSSALYPNNIF